MTNDSTTHLSKDINTRYGKSPRPETLQLVRQFARVYMVVGNNNLTEFVLN